jgi:hypothetical protein
MMMISQQLGWLYSFLAVVMISFSILGLKLIISFLLIVVQSFISVDIANMIIVVTIFVESENISLRLHLLRR